MLGSMDKPARGPWARVAPDAQPEELTVPGANRAVLVLHGFTGFPGDMRLLAHRIHEAGWSVSLPRLAGHGTSGADFATTGWKEWLRSATDAWVNLRSAYSQVVVLGLSMGGLLATILAQGGADGLVLLAPAFQVSNPLVRWTPVLRWIVPRRPVRNPEVQTEAARQYLSEEYWRWQWPVQTSHLYRLVRKGGAALPHVTCPVSLIVSRADRTVPVGVADFVARRLGTDKLETTILEESGHVLPYDTERETVFRVVTDWLARLDDAT